MKIRKIALTLAAVKLFSSGSFLLENNTNFYNDHTIAYADELILDATNITINDDIIYDNTNIYMGYDENGDVYYKRYDPVTSQYKDISIYDEENIQSHQYGGLSRRYI